MTILDVTRRGPSGGSDYRLELTGADRDALGTLATELAETPPGLIDDAWWLTQARRLSCRAPVRLLEAVRRYRHDPGQDGTLILANLPIDEDSLPDTPTVAESVQRSAAVPAATAVLIGLQLGEVVAYRAEKSGALVQNVVPVQGREESQSNAGSVPLQLHVENAFHPQRPDYVGLICLRNDHAKSAGTLVSSVRNALVLLEPEDREVLREPRFMTVPPPSFQAVPGVSPAAASVHPALLGSPDDPNVCVDFNATRPLDVEAERAWERLQLVLGDVATSLVLQSGEMAFVDNRVVLHGRTQFTPRYDGRDRWLQRIYVHLDNRRSRPHRAGNGAVLS